MLEEEKTIPTETEVPDMTDDAFLSGLLDDEDVLVDAVDADDAAVTGDGAEETNANLDGEAAAADDAPENEEEAADAAAGDTNQPTEEELIDLVYNGQPTSLPRSEVIKLAQKGMNYDHVKGQLDGLRNSDTHRMLAQLAADAGMSADDYLKLVVGNVGSRRAREMAESEGISEELARRLITAEDKVKDYEADAQARSQQEQKNRMLQNFIRAYPDVKPEDIPPEVWAEAHSAGDLKGAYSVYENKLLKDKMSKAEAELEQLRKNESNKQKAVGSVRGSKSASVEDPFLSGLFGN